MKRRPYRMKKRAGSRQATRERIVDALVQLHEELGPKNATISAIAERAGVQRLTVYRHFSNETELFQACTSRWREQHPPPDPQAWSGITDGVARTQAALGALYGYYRATERMWQVSVRDEPEVPALRAPMAGFRAYLHGIAEDLLQALAHADHESGPLRATLAHGVDFSTWASLKGQGLDDPAITELVTLWVRSAADAERPGRSRGATRPRVD